MHLYFYYSLGMTQTPKLTAKVILENFPFVVCAFWNPYLQIIFKVDFYIFPVNLYPISTIPILIHFLLPVLLFLFVFLLTTYFIPVLKFAQNISHNITPSISVIF